MKNHKYKLQLGFRYLKPCRILIILIVIGALLRFINLFWGSPWWFHPDERNVASAVTRLKWPDQMDPEFFAYGTVPIYLNFFTVKAVQAILNASEDPFSLAIKAGRIWSALLSTALIPLMYWFTNRYFSSSRHHLNLFKLKTKSLASSAGKLPLNIGLIAAALTAFSFGFIQFAHFGTFEIWLTLLRLLLLISVIELAKNPNWNWVTITGTLFGLAVGTKITSLVLFPGILVALILGVINKYQQQKTNQYHAIVVLGKKLLPNGEPSSELTSRVLQAVKQYHQGNASKLIFSGGSGLSSQSSATEAQVMRDIALKAGAKSQDIILEDQSTTTLGNALAVTSILRQHQWNTILIITSDYHLFRSLLAFWSCGISAQGLAAPSYSITNYFRESLVAVLDMPRIIINKIFQLLSSPSIPTPTPDPDIVKQISIHTITITTKIVTIILIAFAVFAFTNPFALAQDSPSTIKLTQPKDLLIFLNPSFVHSINVEGGIARGDIPVFYTRHFTNTQPYLYQFTHIFPWVLSWPVLILGIIGLTWMGITALLSLRPLLSSSRRWGSISGLRISSLGNKIKTKLSSQTWIPAFAGMTKKKITNYLLLIIFFFLQFAFIGQLYVKWTRYTIPTLPYLILGASWLLIKIQQFNNRAIEQFTKRLKISKLLLSSVIVWQIAQGLVLSTIYLQPDPRIQAANWAAQNIPQNSRIISEPWDLGIIPFNPYFMSNITLFNFYELDHSSSEALAKEDRLSSQRTRELQQQLANTDYIILLGRRIWKHSLDHSDKYPGSAKFYQQLFSGQLGFTKIADFYNQPRLGPFSLNTEVGAEETFSVFDHPHIQIWQKNYSTNSK